MWKKEDHEKQINGELFISWRNIVWCLGNRTGIGYLEIMFSMTIPCWSFYNKLLAYFSELNVLQSCYKGVLQTFVLLKSDDGFWFSIESKETCVSPLFDLNLFDP